MVKDMSELRCPIAQTDSFSVIATVASSLNYCRELSFVSHAKVTGPPDALIESQ